MEKYEVWRSMRDSLCVALLLPCVAYGCMLHTVCKVERFVLTSIERRLLLLLLLLLLIIVSIFTVDYNNTLMFTSVPILSTSLLKLVFSTFNFCVTS